MNKLLNELRDDFKKITRGKDRRYFIGLNKEEYLSLIFEIPPFERYCDNLLNEIGLEHVIIDAPIYRWVVFLNKPIL